MAKLRLFHATRQENADKIKKSGFLPDQNHYFADRSLAGDPSLGDATCVFSVDFQESEIGEFMLQDQAASVSTYREWLIPGEVVNRNFRRREYQSIVPQPVEGPKVLPPHAAAILEVTAMAGNPVVKLNDVYYKSSTEKHVSELENLKPEHFEDFWKYEFEQEIAKDYPSRTIKLITPLTDDST